MNINDTTAIRFDNTYARLPERFFARQPPTPMPAPTLFARNQPLADELGLSPSSIEGRRGLELFAGVRLPDSAEPIAMAYAGHQFGGFAPALGDGRAVLLGEIIDRHGVRRDIQLKGSGRTPFSRDGDGRAVLGPVLREYVVSEAMHAMGVPTTRALAAALTGETVMRERPLPGAVLTRVAKSLVRVGTFQYFAARRDIDALRELADYVIARHYPAITDSKTPYLALLGAVAEAQASLVARWMQLGFIHGVMNTDNMQIAGETIDYGPCAFMDWYDPKTVYSSIDYMGRYAYVNQPAIAHWNLGCLAGALLPIIGDDQDTALEAAREVLEPFPTQFETAWLAGFRPKLGLTDADEEDAALIRDLLSTMHDASADFTLTFRALAHFATEPNRLYQLFPQPAGIDDWLRRWQQRLERETITGEEQHRLMRYANPAVIPRNHLVEQAIQSALDGDFNDFQRLLDATTNPFVEPDDAALTEPPEPEQVVRQTFCGT